MGGGTISSSANVQMNAQTSKSKAFAMLTLLFFMWGFITCLNDILIPYLREVFALNYFQAMLVQFAFFGAYFIGSLVYFIVSTTIGDPITKIGYKNGIIIGLVISSIGCALFVPAAQFLLYGFFLAALFCLGIGLTVLQIAANPYVAILGSPETASSRLNLAQGFNSFGTTIAPVIGGFLIFSFFGGENVLGADAVKIPYLGLSALFLLLALVIKLTDLPVLSSSEEIPGGAGALKYRHLVLGMVGIFMYVGGEVAIGSLLVNFFGLENIVGLSEGEASAYLSFYWGGAMIGRFLGAISMSNLPSNKKLATMLGTAVAVFLLIFGVIYTNTGIDIQTVLPFVGIMILNLLAFMAGKSSASRTLAVFSSVVVLLLLIAISTDGLIAFWAIIGIGLFNSIMWSNIFTLAIDGLGKYTSQGSSLLVMAILGGALIPLMQGALADWVGVQYSFALPIICYLYLFFYGVMGHKKTVNPLEA
ncbi:sugar MFS transporter [Reichenbachiella ulvae]|uniref:Sugar MFS transporter n=1 Tax=Reichenbachiella ulvae TaxID=2980104 RepID=A0ABT3CNS4_9BACT|nr:sugar MFS transporter [Reichenbachiella ulvae]MCV9385262.1 sugar MFS transporter [Reichenbachiella ulvae]